MPETKLFIRNLPWSCDEAMLRRTFSPFGEVVFSRLCRDHDTGKTRGFGFVAYCSKKEADAAKEALNGSNIGGRAIEVRDCEDRPEGNVTVGGPTAKRVRSEGSPETNSREGGYSGERVACRLFARGECTRGDTCRFTHILPPPLPPPSSFASSASSSSSWGDDGAAARKRSRQRDD